MAESLILTEQRTLTRRELIYYLKASDRNTSEEIGRMADIHIGGMLLLCQQNIPAGKIFELDLELPKVLAEKTWEASIALSCEALWSRHGPKNSNFFEVGMKFIGLGAQEKNIINTLIKHFAMPGSST